MRILVTGASGVIGSEVTARLGLAAGPVPVTTARRPAAGVAVPWDIGRQPAPPRLTGGWDVIVHTAASTRWTLTRAEAADANVTTLREVLGLAGPDTHLVHLSTAYVAGGRNASDLRGAEFEGYRNGYEWSKAVCEEVAGTEHRGPLTIVRPPLVVGRRADGRIARFSGPYTLFSALVSGLAAVVIGDPDGYAEIAPVDEVAEAVVSAALGAPPAAPCTEVVAAGRDSLRLSTMVDIVCRTVNEYRAAHGAEPIATPPTVPTDSWDRFYLPLTRQWLSPMQQQAVDLLAMFQSYTSMAEPFEPTRPVRDPGAVVAASVARWAAGKPRQALATPTPWTLVGPG
ncbi:SDR family oxidoreductase [Streptantibioticus silvisoli]|uniref:SDR family oxidoreductase n=1 Tax=Streptantibioticus silvisoli TaxID=2705255 RepID=A0ABT6W3C7_9ACTN|nr:SDR family oxidoreductase [Streptantibioticus silvisoli]MDI5964487.1 SDR family oxidoreductase [Streptantibioticus silvisoli]